ncbi:tail tube protein [Achromobacter phage Mano]|uniref:Tail tube protein n=1 Tax=Achromobacter phage Mano TaxID=2767570 RepID=A0A7L8G6R6_9CAUD|nr:head closure [Achromobacter phage Mano]QOE32752.1 tail tube protein [Achromobacter phage Mano]
MAARDVVKYFNIFVDGRGYAGQSTEFNPPNLSLATEEFRAGGMAAPVDLTMGMEKLVSDFSLQSYNRDVLANFGVVEGQLVPFVIREALESWDGTQTGVVHTMRAKIVTIEQGTRAPGQLAPMKVNLSLAYYKLQHGGQVVHEIDVENMVANINGTDLLAGFRGLLGM